MTSEKPNISLTKTLLIILGIVIAVLLSFGSRVLAFEPADLDSSDNLVTDAQTTQDPAISSHLTHNISEELTSLFLSKLAQLNK